MRLYNISSVHHTFENYKVLDGNRVMYDTLKGVSEGTDSLKMVFCYGGNGNGKTHLLEATVIALAKRGSDCQYHTASQVLREIKSSFDTKTFDATFKKICEQRILIMDDLGMGTKDTVWEQGIIEDIVNERYSKRFYPDEMLTVICTNKELGNISDRITGRFYDPEFGRVVNNAAGNYRMRKVK